MSAEAKAAWEVRYADFLQRKERVFSGNGVQFDPELLNSHLKPFQRALTSWSLRKGRAALFADTGLGKTLMQLAWAQHAAERTLIVAPLAVARQTVAEGQKFGIPVTYARQPEQSALQGITVTTYEQVAKFAASDHGAVVLDESSILKSFEGKVRTRLIEQFAATSRRLCCTATPAPNDIAELANHAEFLGILSRTEMLATFFVHDENGWRLKRHARRPFFRWLASWAMAVKRPSDLGFDDEGYDLPPLEIRRRLVPAEWRPKDQLFAVGLKGITERSEVRKSTVAARVQATVDLVRAEPSESWLIWCGLNDEGRQLAKALPEAALIEGADPPDRKSQVLLAFAAGECRTLITKPSIAGFGMNFQRCARLVFVGLGDSYEQYYQAIRRCWRYGQDRPVHVYVVLSDAETPIYDNVLRKERDAQTVATELVQNLAEFERAEIQAARARLDYDPQEVIHIPPWLRKETHARIGPIDD